MKIARIDKLGRIVIPMTYRKQLGIKSECNRASSDNDDSVSRGGS